MGEEIANELITKVGFQLILSFLLLSVLCILSCEQGSILLLIEGCKEHLIFGCSKLWYANLFYESHQINEFAYFRLLKVSNMSTSTGIRFLSFEYLTGA